AGLGAPPGQPRGAGLSTPAVGRTLLVGMTAPLAGSRRSTCTQGDATNKPQPSVPTRTATGLREPSVPEPQPGRITSSFPRRSNWTPVGPLPRPGCCPPSPRPSTGASPTLKETVPAFSSHTS